MQAQQMTDQERDRILLRTLVALAWADGQVTPDEGEWLERVLIQSGLPTSDIEPMLASPVPVPEAQDLRRALPDLEDREIFLRLALVVSLADGTTCLDELQLIRDLAGALEVPAERLEHLRQETVLA